MSGFHFHAKQTRERVKLLPIKVLIHIMFKWLMGFRDLSSYSPYFPTNTALENQQQSNHCGGSDTVGQQSLQQSLYSLILPQNLHSLHHREQHSFIATEGSAEKNKKNLRVKVVLRKVSVMIFLFWPLCTFFGPGTLLHHPVFAAHRTQPSVPQHSIDRFMAPFTPPVDFPLRTTAERGRILHFLKRHGGIW